MGKGIYLKEEVGYKPKVVKTTKKNKGQGKILHNKTVVDGITFDSKMESDYYKYLKEQQRLGIVKSFKLQPEYILQPKFFILNNEIVLETNHDYKEKNKERLKWNKEHPDNKINIIPAIKYISDFEVIYRDGSIKAIDPKGIKTADFKLKEKMFNFKYPQYGGLKCIVWEHNNWYEWNEFKQIEKTLKNKNK